MTSHELRNAFFSFAGQSVARRFIVQLRSDKEGEERPPYRTRNASLRYWQARLWESFQERLENVPDDLNHIRRALLWCDVHNRQLEKGRAVVVHNKEELDMPYRQDCDRLFPFGFGFWSWVCPECVLACRQWYATAALAKRDETNI